MKAAILDGTLWLCIPIGESAWPYGRGTPGMAPGLAQHVMNLYETQKIAALFREDVPTLLSKTFNVDLHEKWRELTQQPDLSLN